ncbi:agmatine deiminase [Liquorilactobacillus sicerae]|uniref:agmatine deiminase n=1 Tax=Liquorilactobacillus sicerae TaxID=1416943 RepID=UPI00247FBBF5|nr:agmatine deiminase [Liquorilactobacillus sicerae]
MKLTTTPKNDGWYFPAEFEPHKRTYLIWPKRTDTWRNGAKPAQKIFAQVAEAISHFEPVTMLTNAEQFLNARAMLPDSVQVIEMSSNDAWCRDCGPTFLINDQKQLRSINWRFNAWGGLVDGLYFPWDLDDQVAQKISELEQVDEYFLPDFVLEGGSFQVDGQGTAIVTKSCLLSAGRNPKLSQAQIEQILKDYLNVQKVLWLPYGLDQDETNGHVDNICAFIRPGVVVLGWPEDHDSKQYGYSLADYQYLQKNFDAQGRSLEIQQVIIPTSLKISATEAAGIDQTTNAKSRKAGDYLPASYINFYFCNGGLILPAFGVPEDELAKDQFQDLFPKRQIVQLNTREILLGGGNIHCITQQVPTLTRR